jgi:sterol desaturase/sphingolipid hydroxylase (fatty acid hydroxylase superfamily)
MLSAGHYAINHEKEPIRLFESDFLEFFTHIHPSVVLLIWVPVSVFFLLMAILQHPAGGLRVVFDVFLGFTVGLFLWTLTEYTMHRFVFHFRPRSPFQERLTYLFHGIHHHQPKCKTRLVMPPAVSIPLALLFFGGFYLVLGILLGQPWWIAPTFSGFIAGYISYDMLHYATHHFPMRKAIPKYLKRYHLQHHYKTPDQRYGVSSPLWDVLLGTKPPDS